MINLTWLYSWHGYLCVFLVGIVILLAVNDTSDDRTGGARKTAGGCNWRCKNSGISNETLFG